MHIIFVHTWIMKSFSKVLQGLTPQHWVRNPQRKEGLTVFGVERVGTARHSSHHPQDTKSQGEGSITLPEEPAADILKPKETRKPWTGRSSRSRVPFQD